jgi:hypothetical protein
MNRKEDQGTGSDMAAQAEPDGFAAAVAAEIATLRAAGFSKAYICERSFDIEERVRGRLTADPPDPHPHSPYHFGED